MTCHPRIITVKENIKRRTPLKFTKILSSAKQHTEGPNVLEEGLKISENLISRKGGGLF